MIDYQPYADAENVAQVAADKLATRIQHSLKQKNRCHIALPGGTTPSRCLELLACKDLPWQLIHWYLGDERVLPKGDEQRNDEMIERCLWSRVDVPMANRHPISAELGAEKAALRYAELIGLIGNLDIVVLGMGEDGHTASLFPGNAALDDTRLVVPVHNAPKLPAERVSLSLAAIQQAGERHVIVTGQGKHDVMCQIRSGIDLPVTRIGEAHWYVDQAASCL